MSAAPLLVMDRVSVEAAPTGDVRPRRLLDDFCLELRRGEIIALVGESGSGKSMAARSILRLLPPGVHQCGGQVQFEGMDLAGLGALLNTTALPVVASGGVSGVEDLIALARLEVAGRTLAGAIVGKAIVDGRFSVEEGIAACAASA